MDQFFLAGDLQIKTSLAANLLYCNDEYRKYLDVLGGNQVIVNLEGPILEEHRRFDEALKTGPSIYSDPVVLSAFPDSRVLWLLANNHIMDYGVDGLDSTMRALTDLDWVGHNRSSLSRSIHGSGIEVWNIASPEWSSQDYYGTNYGVPNIYSCVEYIEEQMAKSPNSKLVLFHGGSERSNHMPDAVKAVFRRLSGFNLVGFIMCHSHKRGAIYYEEDILVCTGLGNLYMESAQRNEGITLGIKKGENGLIVNEVIVTEFSAEHGFKIQSMNLNQYEDSILKEVSELEVSELFPYVYSRLYGTLSYYLDIKLNLRRRLRRRRLAMLLSFLHDDTHLQTLKKAIIDELY
jgi:hypothetical protein